MREGLEGMKAKTWLVWVVLGSWMEEGMCVTLTGFCFVGFIITLSDLLALLPHGFLYGGRRFRTWLFGNSFGGQSRST